MSDFSITLGPTGIQLELPDTTGWYEFIKRPEATTHIAYMGESGAVYIPEANITPNDFMNALMQGQAYRLVRVIDIERAGKYEPNG